MEELLIWKEIFLCLGIFVAKVIEITMQIFRNILIIKGERKITAIIAFIEVLLWLVIAGLVLKDIGLDHLWRMFAYAGGYAVGQTLGSLLENRIGLGTVEIEVIVPESIGSELATYLRDKQLGVTTLTAEGIKDSKKFLLLYVPRKEIKYVVLMIQAFTHDSVISIHDIKTIVGGYQRFVK